MTRSESGERDVRPLRGAPPLEEPARDREGLEGFADRGRLSRDDLGYPLILLEEAAARCGERGGERGGSVDGHPFDPLALKAKLACAGSLLDRGRRFAVVRRAGENVRLAILLIGHGRRDDVERKVTEGRSLLESYLGRN